MTEPTSNVNRRTFLQAGAAGLAAASLGARFRPPRTRAPAASRSGRWAAPARR